MKHSFTIVILSIFYVGLITTNLIHLILLILGVLFLLKTNKTETKIEKEKEIKLIISFRNQYWMVMLMYI